MTRGPYELVDNVDYGNHAEALDWLAKQYTGPLSIATGYVGLDGLDALAGIAARRESVSRLLIGAAPSSEDLTGPADERVVRDRFEQSVSALRRERDFSAFPASRRSALERVEAFLESEGASVRRYSRRFLHGKGYLVGELNDAGEVSAPAAALVSSANLTHGGLAANLELGMVHYQPNVVGMALQWYERLWNDAEDFKDALLDLLRPPALESDPQTVFRRALLELYGDEFDQAAPPPAEDNLASFQRSGFIRAKRILNKHGGVLYADGVGMGKTEIGIEFVREHTKDFGHHVLVVSPAQLRDGLWKPRLEEENLSAKVVSYQELANDRQISPGDGRVLLVDKDVYRLVIIDEAHAYRNADNTWYKALDRLMGGSEKRLLLLTATPVNNSLWDLHNLFLLFGRNDRAFADAPLRIPSLRQFFREAGASDDELSSETMLFPLIDALTVRRDRRYIEKEYPDERLSDGTLVKFPTPSLQERRYDLDRVYPNIVRDIQQGIDGLTMARYRPSAYRLDAARESASEAALAGLMQSQMLKRFESSWRAALRTVERMRDANEIALRAVEERGVFPSREVIRDLVDSSREDDSLLDSRLIDESLDGLEDGIPAEMFKGAFRRDLRRDRDLLDTMAKRLSNLSEREDPKIEELREVMESTPAKKVAVFTAFRDTAEYVRDRIEGDPGLLGGRTWTVVIGADMDANARADQIERFCPGSSEVQLGPEPKGGEVDVLLSTDVLSEGQNLQQAQAVLSFDMPWNPQRVVQRNGRIIRLRSPHDTAYLYTLLPEQGSLEQMLQLEARLQAKIKAATAAMGMETPVLQDVDPNAVSKIYADLDKLTGKLSDGDASLLNEDQGGGSAFAGEAYRALLQRAVREDGIDALRDLPWGIGSAFVQPAAGLSEQARLSEPAVFFACRTRKGERYWRMVSASGVIMSREDLAMLRVIDPQDQPGCAIPADLDLERLFDAAAADICKQHNALLDPNARSGSIPASQLWALDILRLPDAPRGDEYDDADEALSSGRGSQVQRELSDLRRKYTAGGMSVRDCADRIVKIVDQFGLRPVRPLPAPDPIEADDLGVVCYQIALPS